MSFDQTFVSDDFSEADGAAIVGKSPDVGGAWTQHPTSAYSGLTVQGGGLRREPNAAATLVYLASDPKSREQEVTAVLRPITVTGNNLGPVGYLDATAATCYGVRYQLSSTRWELFKLVAGSLTNLGNYTQTLAADQAYTVTLRLGYGTQAVLIDGVSRITATDTSVLAPGFVGLRGTGNNAETTANGWRMDSFSARQGLEIVDLFLSPGDGGPGTGLGATYDTVRIPAVAVTSGGTVVAVAEGRIGSESDTVPCDLVCWRGTDWRALSSAVIPTGFAASSGYLNRDPALAYDAANDTLHLMFTLYYGANASPARNQLNSLFGNGPENTGTIWTSRSTDGAATWTTPANITAQVKASNFSAVYTGPGTGVVKKYGVNVGRVCISCRFQVGLENADDVTKHVAYCLYTDDGGTTWSRGAAIPGGAGYSTECQLAELSDGRLIASVRNIVSGSWNYALSEDGGETWGSLQSVAGITDPDVNTGIAAGPSGRAYVSHPNNGTTGQRRDLTVRWSADLSSWSAATSPAENLPSGTRVETYGAGYSTMALRVPQQDLIVVFERGDTVAQPYDALSIASVPLEWLGADDEPEAEGGSPRATVGRILVSPRSGRVGGFF